jgi:hypothetical protein
MPLNITKVLDGIEDAAVGRSSQSLGLKVIEEQIHGLYNFERSGDGRVSKIGLD